MTLTIRIANRVRLTAPVTQDRLMHAGRAIQDEMARLRLQGPVSVTLEHDHGLTSIIWRD